VLDVTSGPGSVARLAATAVGPGGRVVASDISEPMLALAAATPAAAGAAVIEFLACPASAIDAPDGSFDAVLCQHGLQFFPEKQAALLEMRRSPGRAGSRSCRRGRPSARWACSPRSARRWQNSASLSRTRGPLMRTVTVWRDLLRASGWRDVRVQTVDLDARWDSADQAADTVSGTPFGPLVSALPADVHEQVRARLIAKLGGSGDGITVRTASNIARALK